jgi:hypothetical protein
MKRGSGAEEITFLFRRGIYILQETVYTALHVSRLGLCVFVVSVCLILFCQRAVSLPCLTITHLSV